MTNIVQLTTVHHLYDTRIYHKQCKFLAKAGFHVTLIASQIDDRTEFVQDHIQMRMIKKRKNRIARFLFSSWDAYRLAKSIPDVQVYHFHDPELFFVGWWLKRKGNCVVYDVHEDYETSIRQKRYIPNAIKPILLYVFLKLENMMTRQFDIILAEKYYQERFPQGFTILNYPILQHPDTGGNSGNSDTSTRPHLNKGTSSMKFIYTGNITEDRGALHHASLPRLDPQIVVRLVGYCPSELAERMVQNAGDSSARLTIEGIDQYIPREQIDMAYQSEDWLAGLAIFPYTEHYAKKELTKFFEYMYAGIPILCSNFPYWKQFVETYHCGVVVDPNNQQNILEAISYLASHPEEAKEMGRNGRNAVKSQLNWAVEGSKLVDLYRQWIKRNAIN